ncbi:MAG TPA: NADH-quinone oxidoreductase subunit C [Candidatus Limnocylindrales bacterium]|nr:NADH-quinone oxidoreductase subunit C [Candidatus Limnocylindrales bacterium]
MSALESANKIKAKFGDIVAEPTEFRGEISLKISDAEQIFEVCNFAKRQLGFDYLVDISSVDNYGDDPRWTVIYHLRSLTDNVELRLKTNVSEEKSELPSVLGVWRTSNWHEREIYDMMGIRFSGHPDLRRILMWEGYPYFPLRKDFPLAGKPTDLPGVAFTQISPMEGGPFVTIPSAGDAIGREPRVRTPEE